MLQTFQKTLHLSPTQIQSYSVCPRQFGFELQTPIISKHDPFKENIKLLIKQCYINRTQHGYNPQWETIKQRVNKICFVDTDINDKEAFKLASKRAIQLLAVMHIWYTKHFSNDSREALVNVPLQVTVNKTIISDTLDIALLDTKYQVVPVIFNDTDILPNMMYNNMKFKTLLWLIYKEINIIPKVSEYIVITDLTVQVHKLFNKTHMDTIDNYVNFIVRAIENKIFYPSVSEHCSGCNFKDVCII